MKQRFLTLTGLIFPIFLLVLISTIAIPTRSQQTEADQLVEVKDYIVDETGIVYVAGQSLNNDAYIGKILNGGILEWEIFFGGSEVDYVNELILHPSGNLILLGNTAVPDVNVISTSPSTFDDHQLFSLFVSPSGEILSGNYIDPARRSASSFGFPNHPEFLTAILDSRGDLIIRNTNSIQKIEINDGNSGHLLWKRTIDAAMSWVRVDSEDNVILSVSPNLDFDDSYMEKIAPSGNVLWSLNLDRKDGIILDREDNIFLMNSKNVEKFDLFGDIRWQKNFGAGVIEGPSGGRRKEHQMLIDSDGNLITVGSLRPPIPSMELVNSFDDNSRDGNFTGYLAKIKTDGEFEFTTFVAGEKYGNEFNLLLDPIITMASQDLIVNSGHTALEYVKPVNAFQPSHNGDLDIYLTIFNPDGIPRTSTYFGGAGAEWLDKTLVDGEDNVWLIGRTFSQDFLTTSDQRMNGFQDLFLTKWSMDGDLLTSRLFGNQGVETLFDAKISSMESLILVGYSSAKGLPKAPTNFEYENQWVFVSSISEDGSVRWTEPLGVSIHREGIINDVLPIIIVAGSMLVGLLFYVNRHRFIARNGTETVNFSHKIDKILSPLFGRELNLIHLFTGTTLLNDKGEPRDDNFVPIEIFDYRDMMHPIKLAIIKLLYDNTRMTTQELKELTGLSHVEINNHLQRLKGKEYVATEQAFVGGSIKTIVQLVPRAAVEFKQLKDLLMTFLSNSPNLDRYIEQALEIQSNTKPEDLYPVDLN